MFSDSTVMSALGALVNGVPTERVFPSDILRIVLVRGVTPLVGGKDIVSFGKNTLESFTFRVVSVDPAMVTVCPINGT